MISDVCGGWPGCSAAALNASKTEPATLRRVARTTCITGSDQSMVRSGSGRRPMVCAASSPAASSVCARAGGFVVSRTAARSAPVAALLVTGLLAAGVVVSALTGFWESGACAAAGCLGGGTCPALRCLPSRSLLSPPPLTAVSLTTAPPHPAGAGRSRSGPHGLTRCEPRR